MKVGKFKCYVEIDIVGVPREEWIEEDVTENEAYDIAFDRAVDFYGSYDFDSFKETARELFNKDYFELSDEERDEVDEEVASEHFGYWVEEVN